MKRGDLETFNGWCSCLDSGIAKDLRDGASTRLKGIFGDFVKLDITIGKVLAGKELQARLFEPFAFAVELEGYGRIIATGSSMLAVPVLKRLAKSDRLAFYETFKRAAIELVILEMAAEFWKKTGINVKVLHECALQPEDAVPFEKAIGVKLAINSNEPNGEIELIIPFSMFLPVTQKNPPTLSVKCSIQVASAPAVPEEVAMLLPGDLYNMTKGGFSTFSLLVAAIEKDRRIEFKLESEKEGAHIYKITGIKEELMMISTGEAHCSQPKREWPGFMVPVRVELLSFEMPLAVLGGLSPGSVVDPCIFEGNGMKARMFVCGALFAEGRVERHDDFEGFRVEKVF